MAQRLDTQISDWGDQGNGTYKNPVLKADYSDPDLIRVGSDFYLIVSEFHYVGIQVLHSKDLVNWQIIGQVFPRLTMDAKYDQMTGYVKGTWAPSLCYHDGQFYWDNRTGPILTGNELRLRGIYFGDTGHFEYSLDGKNFTDTGATFPLTFKDWKGARLGIFCYGNGGGAADIDSVNYGYFSILDNSTLSPTGERLFSFGFWYDSRRNILPACRN